MRDKRPVDEISIEELERILAIKKREARQKQLQRMKQSGRVVDVNSAAAAPPSPPAGFPGQEGLAPPPPNQALSEARKSASPPPIVTPGAPRFEDDALLFADSITHASDTTATDDAWRRFVNNLLFLVEIVAVIGLVYLAVNLVLAIDTLEDETAASQENANATRMADLPTLVPTPVLRRLDDVVLPTGHTFDESGNAKPNVAEIPAHLLPTVQDELTQLVIERPPPTTETALTVNISRLQLDQSIVQGTDWEALRLGVGQALNGATPAEPTGNVVLAAHNDIYGELFKDLDQLQLGDRITIQTETQLYIYVVTHWETVAPTDTYVMASRDRATLTLISCYPYRQNYQRIVVFAEREDYYNEHYQE